MVIFLVLKIQAMDTFSVQMRIALHKENIVRLKVSIIALKASITDLKVRLGYSIVYPATAPRLIENESSSSDSGTDSDNDSEELWSIWKHAIVR